MTNRLLVVDRNPRDLRVIEVSSRVAGYDVEAFTSLEAAADAVLTHPSADLLIAADDSPGFDAFALCERVRATPGSRDLPILLLLQNYTQQGRLRAIAAGADDALAKPVSTAEVLHRTHALCRRRSRDRLLSSSTPGPGERSGNLADLPTVDLLAIFETWGRSGILHLRTAAGADAAIYIRGGKPVDAEAGGVSGMAALARIFSWETGTFRIELKNIRRADALPGSMSDLVMAGLSDRNASETHLRTGIDRSAVLEVDPLVLSAHMNEMSAERSGLLRLCNGHRTVRAVIDASALSDDEALEGLTESIARGILRPVVVPATESSSPALARATDADGGPDERMSPEGDLPIPVGEMPAQESTAYEVDERDVLGARSPVPSILPPPPPLPLSSTPPELAQSEDAEHLSLTPSATSGETPSRLERALLKHEASDAILDAAVVAGPRDVVVPAADTAALEPRFNMNATLPLGLAGTEVPEHFRALIAETAGSDTIHGQAPPARSVADPDTSTGAAGELEHEPSAPASRLTEAREPAGDDTTALAPPLPATVAELSTKPDSHSGTSDGGRTTFRQEPTFSDEDFTAEQALEELGLSGRGRRARWIAAAVAATALVSFGAHHWLGQRHAGAVTAAQPPVSRPETQLPLGHATAIAATSPKLDLPPEPRLPAPADNSTEHSTPPPTLPSDKPSTSAEAQRAEKPAPEAAREAPRPAAPGPGPDEEHGSRPMLAACRAAVEKHGRHRSAKACEEAVLTNPRSAEALTLLANIEMNRGRMKRAQELATQAAEIDPTMADAYAILGGVLQDSGKDHEAKFAYRKYLRLAPNGRYAGELRSIVGTM